MVLLGFWGFTPWLCDNQSNFSPIPQIYTQNPTTSTKRIYGKFPSFPEKFTFCAKFEQKWFCRDFEVLPPDYVTINQNFSPISQIYTPNNTILTKNNFWKISQFSRKTYIVCKFWIKMVLLGFWSGTPSLCDNQLRFLRFYRLIMWQSIKISVLFHKSTHQTIPFWLKIISGKFPNFPEKLTLCANFGQKWFCWDFEVVPPHYVTIN